MKNERNPPSLLVDPKKGSQKKSRAPPAGAPAKPAKLRSTPPQRGPRRTLQLGRLRRLFLNRLPPRPSVTFREFISLS